MGSLKRVVDHDGAAEMYTYDPFGRLTGVTYPGESVPAVKYAYPTGNALSAPWAITTETRVDPYNAAPTYQRTWTFYDGLGRVVQTVTRYDAPGRAAGDGFPPATVVQLLHPVAQLRAGGVSGVAGVRTAR